MARSADVSVSELQAEAERNRTDLSETVDQLRSKVSDTVTDLRQRVSPDAMKAEVQDYLRTRAETLIDKARENPLQAAAIGLGIAYPVLGILRSIPAPIMMIGAGLFFLGSSSGQSATNGVSKKLRAAADGVSGTWNSAVDAAGANAHDVQAESSDGLAAAKDRISSGIGGLTQKVASSTTATIDRLTDSAATFATTTSHGAANLKQQAVETAGNTAEAVRGGAARVASTVRDTAGGVVAVGADAAVQVRDRAVQTKEMATSLIAETVQQHPLLIGGVGLAIGMLIASALPKSDIEQDILGDASAEGLRRANELASRGFDAAKNVVSGAIADLAENADREGLGPSDLNRAAGDVVSRIQKVAQSAAEVAFGSSKEETIGSA